MYYVVGGLSDPKSHIVFHSYKNSPYVVRQEVLDSVNLLDERRGILHVRRHLAASPLFKGIPNFKETRIAMLRAETVKELFSILDYIRGNYGMNC